MEDIGWDWPLNQGGSIEGFNAQQIDFFKGNPLPSLTRESIQNSLDAKDQSLGEEVPVEVTFEVVDIPKGQVPDRNRLLEHLQLSQQAVEKNSEVNFFGNAIALLNNESITVLKISDYGTTGLRGIGKPKKEWESLVLANGQNFKESSTAGGSFGSGKDAMLGMSKLRTIFYATCNNEGGKAIEGVAKLVTHPIAGRSDDEYRATGFFRESNRSPITNPALFPKFFNRDEIGTDIFVFGFDKPENWVEKIIRSLIQNFLVAIKSGSLVVRVGKISVDAATIDGLLNEYYAPDAFVERQFADTYLSMAQTKGTDVYVEGFDGVGLELYLKPDKNYNNRVAMYRSNGMQIKELKYFKSFVKFAGVGIVRSVTLNEYLRNLEPPMHNDWEENRAMDNPTHAGKVIKAMRAGIQNEITKLASDLIKEDHTLQLDILADAHDQNVVNEPGIGNTKVEVYNRTMPEFQWRVIKQQKIEKKSRKKGKTKKQTNYSNYSKFGDKSRNPEKRKFDSTNTNRRASISLDRVIERSQGVYSLLLTLNGNFKGDLRVVIIGQDGKQYARDILEATFKDEPYTVKNNVIKNVNLEAGRNTISITIPATTHVALGVIPVATR